MVSWFKKLFGKKASGFMNDNGLFDKRTEFIQGHTSLETPWAMFEVVGFEDNGQINVEFNWNSAFIEHLDTLGFTAETEEDTVQLFFYASQMKPTSLQETGDDSVQLDDLPQLADKVNRVVKKKDSHEASRRRHQQLILAFSLSSTAVRPSGCG